MLVLPERRFSGILAGIRLVSGNRTGISAIPLASRFPFIHAFFVRTGITVIARGRFSQGYDRALVRTLAVGLYPRGGEHGQHLLVPGGEDNALHDSPISEEPTDPDEVLSLLDRGVNRSGVNIGSAGHLAYIPGSTLYASALTSPLLISSRGRRMGERTIVTIDAGLDTRQRG